MPETPQEILKQRRAAFFILAAMVLALIHFTMRIDWRGDTAVIPKAEYIEQGARKAHRLCLLLPVDNTLDMHALAASFSDVGITWVMLRLPMWTPTNRRVEYSRMELHRMTDSIRVLRSLGFRIILAPVYWDGHRFSPIPTTPPSASMYRAYSDLVASLAMFAAESACDALLLDGMFGAPAVSVLQWLDLLALIREHYHGLIEVRMDTGLTPSMYLSHIDGAYFESDSLIQAHVAQDFSNGVAPTPLYLMTPDPDHYNTGTAPWMPKLHVRFPETNTMNLVRTAKAIPSVHGIVLAGTASIREIMERETADGVRNSLRNLRKEWLSLDLRSDRPSLKSVD